MPPARLVAFRFSRSLLVLSVRSSPRATTFRGPWTEKSDPAAGKSREPEGRFIDDRPLDEIIETANGE